MMVCYWMCHFQLKMSLELFQNWRIGKQLHGLAAEHLKGSRRQTCGHLAIEHPEYYKYNTAGILLNHFVCLGRDDNSLHIKNVLMTKCLPSISKTVCYWNNFDWWLVGMIPWHQLSWDQLPWDRLLWSILTKLTSSQDQLQWDQLFYYVKRYFSSKKCSKEGIHTMLNDV